MTFDEAMDELAALVTILPGSDNVVHATFETASGGLRKSVDDPLPALYATRELAIAAWCETVAALIEEHEPHAISFADGPHLDKHLMTNQSQRNLQRTVEDRFSVTACVGIIHAPTKTQD